MSKPKKYFAIIENNVVVHVIVAEDKQFVDNLLQDPGYTKGRTLSFEETGKGKGYVGEGHIYRPGKKDFIPPSPGSLGGNWEYDEVKKEYKAPEAIKDTVIYKHFFPQDGSQGNVKPGPKGGNNK